METLTKNKSAILFWQDLEGMKRVSRGAECAAIALNALYSKYKFSTLADIPADPRAWAIKFTLQNDKELRALSDKIKIDALNISIPDWIAEQRDAMLSWNATKNSHTQYLQFTIQQGEQFVVDEEKLSQHLSGPIYKKYLSDEQAERLNRAKRYIAILDEAGITYPMPYMAYFKTTGNPFCRAIGGKLVPCREYVLTGEVFPNAPMAPLDMNNDYEIKDLS